MWCGCVGLIGFAITVLYFGSMFHASVVREASWRWLADLFFGLVATQLSLSVGGLVVPGDADLELCR